MFTTESEKHDFAIKPMNCPGHLLIYKSSLKSYRDLPLRLAEFGSCCRNEASGALHGIMRVRGFVQDDGHILCTDAQVGDEVATFCRMLTEVYADFGFGRDRITVKLATRPAQRIGDDATWDRTEKTLGDAVRAAGLDFVVSPGEGAFYGPKLEFTLVDAIGRGWQCGTLQMDFVLPERLDATYVAEDGQKHRPVMLHRAMLGSIERFVGVMIEHYAGRLPLWLAPVQTVVATITSDAEPYAREVANALAKAGIRTDLDVRNEKINLKVREHSLTKTPAIVVVGRREAEERTVAIRRLGGNDQEVLALDAAVAHLMHEGRSPAGHLPPQMLF
jgi:threonyl-tRNA synthetase